MQPGVSSYCPLQFQKRSYKYIVVIGIFARAKLELHPCYGKHIRREIHSGHVLGSFSQQVAQKSNNTQNHVSKSFQGQQTQFYRVRCAETMWLNGQRICLTLCWITVTLLEPMKQPLYQEWPIQGTHATSGMQTLSKWHRQQIQSLGWLPGWSLHLPCRPALWEGCCWAGASPSVESILGPYFTGSVFGTVWRAKAWWIWLPLGASSTAP